MTLLGRVDRVSLSEAVLALAARLPPPDVRTLDALHVASAAELSGLECVLTYDRRMAAAAEEHGLSVMSPGQ